MANKAKRILCNMLAVCGLMACAGTFGACETNEPKVELEISFNEKTYSLEYTLFRKLTPTTVKHFLALVENKYYDGLCVHNYKADTALYTGGYTYDSEAEKLTYKDYYATVKEYLPQSVWLDKEKQQPTYTLYGEFAENDFQVKSGALQESFGSLVMTYEQNDENADAFVERNDGGGIARRDYQENSATSMFYISLGTTVKSNDEYCVFATLTEEGKDELRSLQAAIKAYIEEQYDETSDFTQMLAGEVVDNVAGNKNKAYEVPKQPIVIKAAKVLKY